MIRHLPGVLTSFAVTIVVSLLGILQQLGDLRQIKLCVIVSSHVAVRSDDSAQLRVRSISVVWSIRSITVVDLASNLVEKRL